MGVEDGRWGGGGYKTEKGATWYETLKEAFRGFTQPHTHEFMVYVSHTHALMPVAAFHIQDSL
jgi:hypothetical protein